MQVKANIFREYDIRGNAEQDLTDEAVYAIGRAYGTRLVNKSIKQAAVGGDIRLSTERIKDAVIKGLLSTGVNVIDIGVVTTPLLYWSQKYFNLKGGVMVTGSHNPPEMNGLKLCAEFGTLWGDDIQAIRRAIESGEFEHGEGKLEHRDIKQEYLNMLKAKFNLNKKFKVICDSGNGAAGGLAQKFFEMLNCECIELYGEHDGNFPNHHPDPQKRENLQDLIKAVKLNNADIGFAFDGDADRIGVVDDMGEVIFGDRLMALYWREILQDEKYKHAKVIIEPKCSMALAEEVEKLGGEVLYWKSGHSLIKAKMREINAPFAGEYSGHMFFADEYYGFDDSFYAAGRVLRIMDKANKSLSELVKSVPLYPSTQEARINCSDELKFKVVEDIKDEALKFYQASVIDGIRILYQDGWGLIRASNTQSVITARCEGRTENALKEIMNDIKSRILAAGLENFEWSF